MARFIHMSAAAVCAATLTALLASGAFAGDLERRQAKRMHDRLAGVSPTEDVVQAPGLTRLDVMESLLVTGGKANQLLAADEAMQNHNFYNVTLKNFAAPWTNRDQDVFTPLNDYTTTVIGMIRDSATIPFTDVLSSDILYVGDPLLGLPAYSMTDNDHYAALENQGIDLQQNLVRRTQSGLTDIPTEATAGVMTTRAAAQAFFIAGTNRAMFRFTLMNHLCTDLEPLNDIARPADRIRQDVSRSPGGDSRIFLNSCVGCHAGMDPMAQAFAYYNFDDNLGKLVYTENSVQQKYLINADNFKFGFVTPNDEWDNFWRVGQNAYLGWANQAPNGSGQGAKSLGQELAQSDAFAQCQTIKAFRTVCLREPTQTQVNNLVTAFTVDTNYDMKRVFAESAIMCMGD